MKLRSSDNKMFKKNLEDDNDRNTKMSLKSIVNIVKTHELNVRDIAISSDERYLVSCSEMKDDELPHVLVWRIETLLEKGDEPVAILKIENTKQKTTGKLQLSNWLLCVDTIVASINGEDLWFVCTGSLHGELYIWSGKIDEISREWIFENSNFKKISVLDHDNPTQKAIFKIKILESMGTESLFNLYLVLNNIQTIGSEPSNNNTIKELLLNVDQSGVGLEISSSKIIGVHEGWILAFSLYNKTTGSKNERFIVSGSSNGIIKKWNLTGVSSGSSVTLGRHEDAVNSLIIFSNGNKVASGSADSSIRIWKTDPLNNPEYVLLGHHDDEVISLDLLKSENLLISASKDNTIKIWDTHRHLWIRNIDIDYLLTFHPDKIKNDNEIGLDFLRDIFISPDNRYIFVTKKN